MPLIVRDVFKVMFFVHIDEFQSFSTDAFASLLSEARKFAVHFSLGNQYTEQLSDEVRAAVLGNAGTLMVFRVSAEDARPRCRERAPSTTSLSIVSARSSDFRLGPKTGHVPAAQ